MSFRLLKDPWTLQNKVLYVCTNCKPIVTNDKVPGCCVLNGLQCEPIPNELKNLDPLSLQLIQRAKCFQTVVRLGTYTGKVPSYNSLKAIKGAMFHLPLPLEKTMATLDEVGIDLPNLPKLEFYIIVNSQLTKSNTALVTLLGVFIVNHNINMAAIDHHLQSELQSLRIEALSHRLKGFLISKHTFNDEQCFILTHEKLYDPREAL